jgi:hypothetical protein
VTVTVVVQATGANGYTNTVTLTPLVGVTNLGSSTATAPGTATWCSHAKPDQDSGQQHDRGGRYNQLHDRDRQHGAEHADDGEHRGHLPANLTAYSVVSAVQGGASVPTAFNLSGTTVRGSVTIPLNGTVSVTDGGEATAAGGYTNTVTLTPLQRDEPGQHDGDGAGHGGRGGDAEPEQDSGQHNDRGGRHDQLHDRDRQRRPEHADDGEHRGHLPANLTAYSVAARCRAARACPRRST